MNKSDELCAEVMKNAKLEKCCEKMHDLVDERISEMTGKFDWIKSVDGKLLLELQKLLRQRF